MEINQRGKTEESESIYYLASVRKMGLGKNTSIWLRKEIILERIQQVCIPLSHYRRQSLARIEAFRKLMP